MERRVYDDIEIRSLEDGRKVITGYAIVFDKESRDLGGFTEVIKPEAMEGANVSDVVALFNHDPNIVLGRTEKTLKLIVDEGGVRYEIEPPNTSQANDLMESIARGDIRGSSFGFTIRSNGDKWTKPQTENGLWKRDVTGFDKIYDVSPVVFPAYEATDTSLAKRSLGMEKDKIEREFEKAQQDKAVEEARKSLKFKRLKLDLLKYKEE